jgi:LacI family transcriptional regulator
MVARMKDIASLLGISPTTVSHVLRGRDEEFRIAAETARRVREAAERLGYRPSHLALNFKNHRSYSLALAVGDICDPHWSGVALGAQQEADRQGYLLVVTHTGESDEKEKQVVELLRDRRVDGLILSPAHIDAKYLRELQQDGLPFVLVDRSIDDLDVSSVVTDSFAGLDMLVEHLADHDHERIAYLGGPTHISAFRDRLEGYKKAMARRRLRPGPVRMVPSDADLAEAAARDIFHGRGQKPTAIIGGNMWLTVGLLRGAPDDVAVAGFDDILLSDLIKRPLYSAVQPREELGRQAVKLLLAQLGKPAGPRRVVLPPRLVVHEGRG